MLPAPVASVDVVVVEPGPEFAAAGEPGFVTVGGRWLAGFAGDIV